MSASLFDLYVLEICPDEYVAMRAARGKHIELFNRFVSGDSAVTEAECIAAKIDADNAEQAARQAFSARFKVNP